jgi:peroxiredoxin
MRLKVSRRAALRLGGLLAGGVAGGFSTRPAAAQSLGDISGLETVPPGQSLPPFQFYTADNKVRTLADYRGQGVVINLWATWCGPCTAELPTMDTLAQTLAKDGIVVLPVSYDIGGATAVQGFYRSHDIRHLPVLLDHNSAILQAWQVPGIPVTVIFDRAGHPKARLVGGADWGTEEAAAKVRSLCGPDLAKAADVRI